MKKILSIIIISLFLASSVYAQPNCDNLIKANVFMWNKTTTSSGSGVILKVNGKLIIITVGHLGAENGNWGIKKDDKIYLLKQIKRDRDIDLAIYEFRKEVPPNISISSIATINPKVGDIVYAVGNPCVMQDVVTCGIIMKIWKEHNNYYLNSAQIYPGSSGGGLYNEQGELIGITIERITPTGYESYLAVPLPVIKEFIKNI